MATKKQKFYNEAAKKAADKQHYHKISYNINQYDKNVANGLEQYNNIEAAKQYAKNTKAYSINNLDVLLEEFEKNFTKNGGVILWAETAEDVHKHILEITNRHEANRVVKSKSMVAEEVGLNQFLEKQGIEVSETGFGEYIVQLENEKPYHIVNAAMHKSKEDLQQLFHQKLGTAPDLSPQQLTGVTRENLREQYRTADIGITGANFLVAETGSVALTENEGNARLSVTYPDVHVAITGIEKVIPKIEDLYIFWPLLSTYATGQPVAVYNSLLSGPKKEAEINGPKYMYVILLDNGRTNLLAKEKQREALQCIRCGACLNVCPVYKTIGGHSYGTVYSGPIGSVISPNINNSNGLNHLSNASSLCGKCTETCPVKIDLHNHLLYNRRDAQLTKKQKTKDKLTWFAWHKAMLNRRLMNQGLGVKNFFINLFFKDAWGDKKELPKAKKSFNQLWKAKQHKSGKII